MTDKKTYAIQLNDNEQDLEILKVIISSWNVLKVLKQGKQDITTIAKEINQTEANISMKIKKLQKLGIVKCFFEPAEHGVRKICEIQPTEIKIVL